MIRVFEHILQLDLFRHGPARLRHCPEITPSKCRSSRFIFEMTAHARKGEPCFIMSAYATRSGRQRIAYLKREGEVKRTRGIARRRSPLRRFSTGVSVNKQTKGICYCQEYAVIRPIWIVFGKSSSGCGFSRSPEWVLPNRISAARQSISHQHFSPSTFSPRHSSGFAGQIPEFFSF